MPKKKKNLILLKMHGVKQMKNLVLREDGIFANQ
jgi:hypothetical protein